MTARPTHLAPTALADLASAGRQPLAHERRHLAGCPACAGKVERLTAVVAALRRDPALVGDDAVERVWRRARARARRRQEPVPARCLRAAAAAASPGAPAGLRGAAPPSAQWLFRAGPYEVDVQSFAEGARGVTLLGQVMSPAGGVADLPVHLSGGAEPGFAVTDARGEVRIGPVVGQRLRLVIETDDGIHRLDLRLPRPGTGRRTEPR